MPLITNGPIFSNYKNKFGNWSQDTEDCIVATVSDLLAEPTTSARPGMLLGQIQSGKTRAFIGTIAMAFDNEFEVAIVLTKGTKALALQTLARLKDEFRHSIEDERLLVFDIQLLPESLTDFQLSRKIVIVCKKEDDNLNDLYDAMTDTYGELAGRKVLIVDDEADFASVGYRQTDGLVTPAVIPSQIDQLRQALPNVSYLQVTATPYSLYLQPEVVQPASGAVFKPVRPAFTHLVPVHGGYIGGRYYFEDSLTPGSVASFLRVDVHPSELEVLKQEDQAVFKIEDCLTSPAIEMLRRSIVTFIVGGWIRRWQQAAAGETRSRYSFIVHNDVKQTAHGWQAQVVRRLLDKLRQAVESDPNSARSLVEAAVADLSPSLQAAGLPIPTSEQSLHALANEMRGVMIETVNSQKDINGLLDDKGQLNLTNPYNIFIGGQILDRGLTIENLIGFYYGRSPKTSQQDTVLQHARMYGNRTPNDMAVTRFYTTPANHFRMRTIYEFDAALRDAFDQGAQSGEVVILRTDPAQGVIPCSPSKLLLSNIVSLRPNRRLIPKGFSTNLHTAAATAQIDQLLLPFMGGQQRRVFYMPLDLAAQIIDLLAPALQADEDGHWDADAFKASMRYLANQNPDEGQRAEIVCLASTVGRDDAKMRPDRPGFQDAPESSDDRVQLDQHRGDRPAMILYRENGKPERGWAGQEFYWPVLKAPPATRPVIFASKTL